jgi:hypothetical protein
MALTVNCPSCNRKLRVNEEFLGKKMRCAACDQVFEVPATPPPEEPPHSYGFGEEPAPPPSSPRDHDHDRPAARSVSTGFDDYERPAARYDDRDRGRDEDRPRRRDEDYDDYRYGRRPAYSQSVTCSDANSALWMGLAGLFCCQIFSIFALINGIKALNQINNSNGALSGTGQAIAGIVLGVLGCLGLLVNLMLLMARQH